MITEAAWDNMLKIKTSGRDDSRADQYNYPYEPTPYSVLERLANFGWIRKSDMVLDYGCGKGRVDFFLAYQTKATVIGIEYDERIYGMAMQNKESAASAGKVTFVMEDAGRFEVPNRVNRIYFLNPFSVEILQKAVARIKASYYQNPREILLFFYYPSDEYITYLMTENEMEFFDEIDCQDLFAEKNKRERIMIWKMESDL